MGSLASVPLLSPDQTNSGGRKKQDQFQTDVVSIVTVSFNSVATIERTIDSIKAQTYPATEYIVIDGGSTDGTVDVLRKRSDDINYWVSEPDQGISDAFNKGIARATGKYVAIINSDDWIDVDHMSIAIAALNACSADFVFGDLLLHAANGDALHYFVGDADYRSSLVHYMPFINHPTVVCYRNLFDKIGLFDTSLKTAMDYDWFLRLHRAGGSGAYLPNLLGHMMLGGESDRNFVSALREMRHISVRNGYPKSLAWVRYAYRLLKGKARRQLKPLLPRSLYEKIRETINISYRRRSPQ